MEDQFQGWRQVRQGQVSGEVKAFLDAARIRAGSFEEGRLAGLSEAAAKLGWDEMATRPGLHRFMDTSAGWRINVRDPVRISLWRPQAGLIGPRYVPEASESLSPQNVRALAILADLKESDTMPTSTNLTLSGLT